MAHRESEIIQEERDVTYWHEYKEKGQHEHQKQIALLQQELIDMETSFTEMTGQSHKHSRGSSLGHP